MSQGSASQGSQYQQRARWSVNYQPVVVIPTGQVAELAAGTPANRYTCPIGEPAGRAWLLMRRANVEELRESGELFHTIQFCCDRTDSTAGPIAPQSGQQPGPHPSEAPLGEPTEEDRVGIYFGRLLLSRMVFVRARSLDPYRGVGPNAPFLAEFADIRSLIQMSVVRAKQYNVRLPQPRAKWGNDDTPDPKAYYESSLDDGDVWTWETMLADLWAQLGPYAGAWPGLEKPPEEAIAPTAEEDIPEGGSSITADPAYSRLNLPEDIVLHGVSAWSAVCELLLRIGHVPVYNPHTDSFSVKCFLFDGSGSLPSGDGTPSSGGGTPSSGDGTPSSGEFLPDGMPYYRYPRAAAETAEIINGTALVPQKISVFFPEKWPAGLKNESLRSNADRRWFPDGLSEAVEELETLHPDAAEGTEVPLWANQYFHSSPQGGYDPGYKDDLTTLRGAAANVARAWLAERGVYSTKPSNDPLWSDVLMPRTRVKIVGIDERVRPGTWARSVSWVGDPETSAYMVIENSHSIPSGVSDVGLVEWASVAERFMPPSINRPDKQPSDVVQIIRAWGTPVEGSKYLPGYICTVDPSSGAVNDEEPCWILSGEFLENAEGARIGRAWGSIDACGKGDYRPLFVVESVGSIRNFTLKTDLNGPGAAEAYIIEDAPLGKWRVTSKRFTVWTAMCGFQGSPGTRGVACLKDSGRWIVVALDCSPCDDEDSSSSSSAIPGSASSSSSARPCDDPVTG